MNTSKKTLRIQILLFVLTFFTTTMAGAEWLGHSIWAENFTFEDFTTGLTFSIAFLLILTVHEFGHYFTALRHKVKVTLPYYIPLWLFGISASIGTMGAFIRIKSYIDSRKKYFDIGIAGPLAGFIVALVVLVYGFTHLPPLDHLFAIHPEYAEYGADYGQYVYQEAQGLQFQIGPNLLFWFFETYIADTGLMPHANEVIHYPWLFAGYLALFFTALNLLPIGQLDGGHILYAMVGSKWHSRIASILFVLFITYAGIGVLNPFDLGEWFAFYIIGYLGFLYFSCFTLTPKPLDRLMVAAIILTIQFAISFWLPNFSGYHGWLVFGFLIGRFLGIHHPKVIDNQPLDTKRMILGVVALLVFILCFSPEPFVIQ